MMMWPLIIWMFGLLMIFVTIDAYQHVRYKRYDQVPEHCPRRDKPAYEECQQKLVKKWNLPIKQMNSATRRFCCFHWENLQCELQIAKKCDKYWADKLDKDTMMDTICRKYPRKDFQKNCAGIDIAKLDKEDKWFRDQVVRTSEIHTDTDKKPPSSKSTSKLSSAKKSSSSVSHFATGGAAIGFACLGAFSHFFMESEMKKYVTIGSAGIATIMGALFAKLALF
ncbi:uncharacterized protein LOC124489794 [Dermatophagoides farinae]|nr:uncharacterized protein LOC124489794 [Dermatophagoides farinae]